MTYTTAKADAKRVLDRATFHFEPNDYEHYMSPQPILVEGPCYVEVDGKTEEAELGVVYDWTKGQGPILVTTDVARALYEVSRPWYISDEPVDESPEYRRGFLRHAENLLPDYLELVIDPGTTEAAIDFLLLTKAPSVEGAFSYWKGSVFGAKCLVVVSETEDHRLYIAPSAKTIKQLAEELAESCDDCKRARAKQIEDIREKLWI